MPEQSGAERAQAEREAPVQDRSRNESTVTAGYTLMEREGVIAKLYELWLIRQAKNAATKDDSFLTEQIKQWMGLEGEEELFDGEHGIRVYIKEIGAPNWNLTEAPDEVILHLAREGLLNVKNSDFDKARKNKPSTLLDRALEHKNDGVNYQLRVEKRDDK
jgi:hypothetical protein